MLVRELGLLSEVHRVAHMTAAQAHLLIEVERRGGYASVSELASALLLDKSTVSRAVQTLRDRDWLSMREDPGDRRRKLVELTDAGHEALERCHSTADGQVVAALSQLTPAQRHQVTQGMELYSAALRRVRTQRDYLIRPIAPADNRDIAALMRRVRSEFAAPVEHDAIDEYELKDLAASYSGGARQYFVVEKQQRVVGGGGFAPLRGGSESTCELCKMYLAPEVRGQGLGRALLEHCLTQAKAHGFTRCYLETLPRMRAACTLYEAYGFVALEQRMGNTGHDQCETQYVKDL